MFSANISYILLNQILRLVFTITLHTTVLVKIGLYVHMYITAYRFVIFIILTILINFIQSILHFYYFLKFSNNAYEHLSFLIIINFPNLSPGEIKLFFTSNLPQNAECIRDIFEYYFCI